jgi:hypothetical protein
MFPTNVTDTDKIMGPMAVKILSWFAAAFGGAMLVFLLNASGNTKTSEINSQRLDRVELQLHELQTVYATNKRVDDLQNQVNQSLITVSNKVDNVIELLIKRK